MLCSSAICEEEGVAAIQDNNTARDSATHMAKAVAQEILIQIRVELNDNLVKLKQWVKEELADNAKCTRFPTDLDKSLENLKSWIKFELVDNLVSVDRNLIEAPPTTPRHGPKYDQYSRPELHNGEIGVDPRNSVDERSDDQRKVEFLEAIVFEPKAQLLVDQKIPPNMDLGEVRIAGKQFHSCSVLAAAVLSGQRENAKLLLKSRANPDSVYGFQAGALRMNWSAPCAAATIAKNDESMLKLLLQHRANPTARASNDATLIWQCCYFGNDRMLKFLLDLDECDLPHSTHPAKSQNVEGLTTSPLHISIKRGSHDCARLLIEAGHPLDVPNEENETPLDAAIRFGHPELVTLLIKNGAEWSAHTRRHTQGPEANTEENEVKDEIKSFFSMELPNPVMAYAVVSGLQSQHQQIRNLPREELLRLFQISTKAIMALLGALFVEREVRFKGKCGEIEERKLAVVRRTEVRKFDEGVYKFPVVVPSTVSFEEIRGLLKKGKRPSPEMLKFIDEITPQHREHSCLKHAMETIFQIEHQITPVVVYECVVPWIHHNLFVLKELAHADRFDEIFTNQHCQAMISFAWDRARHYVLRQFADQLCISIFLMFLALQINFQEDRALNFDFRANVGWVAVCTLPFWFDICFAELCFLAVYVKHGWAWKNVFIKLGDLIRMLVDGVVLLPLAFNGINATDDFFFRCFIALVCILKWVKLIDCLTPFRRIGLSVMPILFTLSDLGPSMGVTIMYFAGMAHALIVMDLTPDHYVVRIFQAFIFGFSDDFSTVNGLLEPEEVGFKNWMLRFFLCIATFVFPVTLMNLLIAAMSNSYGTGITHVEKLYQKRCAERAFTRSCVQSVVKNIRCRILETKDPNRERKHLWYCRERDSCEELGS